MPWKMFPHFAGAAAGGGLQDMEDKNNNKK